MYPEEQYAARVLHEGASAYVSKQQPPEELLLALRTVMRGGTYVSTAGDSVPRDSDPHHGLAAHEKLSAREYQIFTLILQNQTPSEIAAELNLSLSTVSNHLAHVKDKLGVRNLGEIISYGHRAGLIETV
jgi:DNA-binding NarL/FixJ family response regulator